MSIGEFAKEIEKMEDRYLFKANRADNGEWVTGYYTKSIVNGSVFGYIRESIFGTDIKIMLNTLCQYTGLKDKNGNLIWENDVVGFWDTYSTENGRAEMDCIGKVVWDDETISFQVTNRLSAESYEVLDECSVIGNIFDNPELLESEE